MGFLDLVAAFVIALCLVIGGGVTGSVLSGLLWDRIEMIRWERKQREREAQRSNP